MTENKQVTLLLAAISAALLALSWYGLSTYGQGLSGGLTILFALMGFGIACAAAALLAGDCR